MLLCRRASDAAARATPLTLVSSPTPFAVIMAGGFGTRFWPASRKSLPKQFLPIAGRRTMIAETAARLKGLVEWERTLVVTSKDHVALVRKYLRKLPPENILAEPVGRNTAPCVAWAAIEIARRDPSAVEIVLPSDHVIQPAAEFRRVLRAAVEEAQAGQCLLTLGIRPTSPATGYGYIELGALVHERSKCAVHAVARFVEKPDRARAEEFLRSGRFLWNAGIFVWSTSAILAALEQHTPALVAALSSARAPADIDRIYPTLASTPVDIAILEKAGNVRVMPIAFAWSDVGSWAALPEVQSADEQRNVVAGGTRLFVHESEGCIVYGKGGEITALIGVKDLVVVRAGKAVLVVPRERAQDVKHIVQRLEKDDPSHL